MKVKREFWLLMAVLFATLTVAHVTAGGAQESGEDQVVIGVSLPTQSVERWVRDKNNLIEIGEERGARVIVQIANDNSATQNSQVENLISQNVDVIIIAPHDAEASATAVKMANDAGIPIFSYVRLILNADISAHVMGDFYGTGVLQGKFLAENAPKGNYILLRGAKEDFNSVLFYEGAMSILRPLIEKGDINVVTDQSAVGWAPANAMTIVENALTAANNDVVAVLSPNDGLAGGAIQALAAQGLAGKVFVSGGDAGVDAAKRIVEGTQSMTVYRDIRKLAETAIDLSFHLAEGRDFSHLITTTIDNGFKEVPTVSGEALIVTKDNLDEILIESGYHKRDDIYR
jgi:D-xylose transport system substrate-binding protein